MFHRYLPKRNCLQCLHMYPIKLPSYLYHNLRYRYFGKIEVSGFVLFCYSNCLFAPFASLFLFAPQQNKWSHISRSISRSPLYFMFQACRAKQVSPDPSSHSPVPCGGLCIVWGLGVHTVCSRFLILYLVIHSYVQYVCLRLFKVLDNKHS